MEKSIEFTSGRNGCSCVKSKKVAWNKGLTKENDARIRKQGETYSERVKSGEITPSFKGKHWSDDYKKMFSIKMKEYYANNPDKVPYIVHHKSKGDSYPEKYFMDIFDSKGIKYAKDFPSCGYFLDFAFENNSYIEIDGEQHYNDKRILEHDNIRNKKLEDFGWKLIARIRWSNFQKMSYDDKQKFIDAIIESIKDKEAADTKSFVTSKIIHDEELSKRRENLINQGKIDKSGRVCPSLILLDDWEYRYNLIMECDVDFTKMGWQSKVEKITKLTRRVISNTIKHFPDRFNNVYIRK